jgi:16S rRNA (guanine966-N2)-methyltransferase
MARRALPKPAKRAPRPRLRVVAGALRGRRLVAPAGDAVRPTKEVVREAVFSALDSRGAIAGAAVLDLYAGTGALAIEALSRGATRAVLVERDSSALAAIAHNVEHVGVGPRARIVRLDAARFLASPPPPEAPFGLVRADPPYDTTDAAVGEMVRALAAPGWLAPAAIVTVERPARAGIDLPDGFRACWERTFGDTLVLFVDASEPPN